MLEKARLWGMHTGHSLLFSVLMYLSCASLGYAHDVNQATHEQLLQIKGIGPKTAQLIIAERERAGPYSSYDDLALRVKGIGPKKLLQMQESGLRLGAAVGNKVAQPVRPAATVTTPRKKP